MLFTNFLPTLLLGAALLTTSTAAPTTNLTIRADGPYSSIKTTQAARDKAVTLCKAGITKRHIDAFGTPSNWPPAAPGPALTVTMTSDISSATKPLGLWTYGLVTCIGVVVTGTPKDGKSGASSSFMLHMSASDLLANEQWARFKKLVDDAKLDNMQGYLSVPDTVNGTPDKARSKGTWDKDIKDQTDQMVAKARDALRDLTRKAPKVLARQMAPALDKEGVAGTMYVDGTSGEVSTAGTKFT